jgi:hypothetical protein
MSDASSEDDSVTSDNTLSVEERAEWLAVKRLRQNNFLEEYDLKISKLEREKASMMRRFDRTLKQIKKFEEKTGHIVTHMPHSQSSDGMKK